jgi:RNA polymerase sigma factor (sigma-70 family)
MRRAQALRAQRERSGEFFAFSCSVLAFGGALLSELKMTDSQRLLAEYAKNGSESAFRELVARYINLVYSTALRLVGGDTQLAEDVTQTVFISLARKGRALSSGVMLGGWLHQHAFHVATKAVRNERLRQSREREAVEMNTLHDDSGANLRQVAPMLDEAITQLGREDRTAILLRFFEQRDFRAVGEALGSNEDAARMRVNRALGKLHSLLKQRGVTLSITALGTALTAEAVTAAPAGLAVTVSGAALGSAAAGAGTALTLTKLMVMTKLQAAVIGAILVGATVTPLVMHHQAKLRQENQALREQLAQLKAVNEGLANQIGQQKEAHASLPPAPLVAASAATNPPAVASPFEQVMEFIGSHNEVPREQIEAYVQHNHRNVESLLAAFGVSLDPSYLREAATNSPNDPAVQFAVIARRVFPDEQRKWVNAFKASSPENALPWYFSALDYFESKQPEQAIQELSQATRRQLYGDYAVQTTQAVEELYASAGWPALAAKARAPGVVPMSYLAMLKELANETVQTEQHYFSQADTSSAVSMVAMGMRLGDQLRRASTGIDQLVGITIEKRMLAQLDPAGNYDFLGRPVSEALAELDRQKQALAGAYKTSDQVCPTLNESELNSYWERKKLYGEAYALQWLQSKHRQP